MTFKTLMLRTAIGTLVSIGFATSAQGAPLQLKCTAQLGKESRIYEIVLDPATERGRATRTDSDDHPGGLNIEAPVFMPDYVKFLMMNVAGIREEIAVSRTNLNFVLVIVMSPYPTPLEGRGSCEKLKVVPRQF